tara:strand:- start:1185 stop:1505 length:321 start_codon:yes stop_codon:yes gene_type:complete
MEGTVNWFNIKKGYGFVKGEDEQDYFIHYTAVPQGVFLKEGDRVSFEPAQTEKGKQAKDVKLLEGGQEQEAPQEETQEKSQEVSEEEPQEEQNTEETPQEEETQEE